MISELVNTLYITYLASEYATTQNLERTLSRDRIRSLILLTTVVILLNVVDTIVGVATLLNIILFIPKFAISLPLRIVFAVTVYLAVLYADIKRHMSIDPASFLKRVRRASLFVLPAYPFLAVILTFFFSFVVDLWEALELPGEKWLNAPIYYGILYGPLAWIYIRVKKHVCEEVTSLPM